MFYANSNSPPLPNPSLEGAQLTYIIMTRGISWNHPFIILLSADLRRFLRRFLRWFPSFFIRAFGFFIARGCVGSARALSGRKRQQGGRLRTRLLVRLRSGVWVLQNKVVFQKNIVPKLLTVQFVSALQTFGKISRNFVFSVCKMSPI